MFWIACPPSCDCRAIVRRAMRVVMGSGLNRVRWFPRLLRIPCGFVSFAPIVPSRCPSRLIRSASCGSCDFPPYCLSPITPRLSCRISGTDFLNASNSMPLQSGLRSGSSLLLAYRLTGSMPPVGSSHHLIERTQPLPAYRRPIPSRCRPANGVAAPIAPRQAPRPSCRRTGADILDVIGCHAVDTVIGDNVGALPY